MCTDAGLIDTHTRRGRHTQHTYYEPTAPRPNGQSITGASTQPLNFLNFIWPRFDLSEKHNVNECELKARVLHLFY